MLTVSRRHQRPTKVYENIVRATQDDAGMPESLIVLVKEIRSLESTSSGRF